MRNNKDTHNELTTGSWFIRIGPAAGLHSVLTLNSNGGWVLCLRATTVDDSVKGNESLVSEKQSVWKINTQKVINFRVLGISRSRHAHTRTRCVRFVTQLRKIFFFFSTNEKRDKEFIVNCLSTIPCKFLSQQIFILFDSIEDLEFNQST